MEEKIDQVIKTLEQTHTLYHELLAMLQQERSAVTNSDIDRLNNILMDKEALLARLAVLETRRTYQLSRIAGDLQLPVQQMTLSKLAKHAPEHLTQKIHHLRSALRKTINAIGKANEESRTMIQHCLNLVKGGLQFFRHWITPPTVYASSGQVDDRTKNGHLLSGIV